MKEKLMEEIRQKMNTCLNERQREQARAVLHSCFQGYSAALPGAKQQSDVTQRPSTIALRPSRHPVAKANAWGRLTCRR